MAKGKIAQQLADEISGILDMSDEARMARAREMGFRYARASQSESSPINDRVGYAMFAESDNPIQRAEELSHTYGPAQWVARDDVDGVVDVKDIQKDIVKSLRDRGRHKEYGATAASIARTANPDDIVNSAGLWDSQDFVSDVWEDVLEPKGIKAVRTNDGLIVFDDSSGIVRSAKAAFDPSKKDSSNFLAGGLPIGAGTVLAGGSLSPSDASARILPPTQDVGSIRAPVNNIASSAADMATQYNRVRKERLHPLLDMALPLGELPEELWRKRAYGEKVKISEYLKAAISML